MIGRIHVRAGFQQQLDDCCVADCGRFRHRRGIEIILDVRLRARLDETLDQVHVFAIDGIM
jgi:hypothetical protein